MHIVVQRGDPLRAPRPFNAADAATYTPRITTFGHLSIDGRPFCRTLEDGILEDPLEQVANWKIAGRCAIPAGVYDLELQDSPKFGVDCPTILRVPGYTDVRLHSGVDIDSTLGCIIVGDQVDEQNFTISGGKARGVYARLRALIQDAVRGRGETVTIEVRNPEVA